MPDSRLAAPQVKLQAHEESDLGMEVAMHTLCSKHPMQLVSCWTLATFGLVVQSFAIGDRARIILETLMSYDGQTVFLRMLYLFTEAWRQRARFARTIMLWSVSGVQAGFVDFSHATKLVVPLQVGAGALHP